MRAFVQLWDRLTRERYAVEDPAMRRFRYGVQVNSLGLTEAQPENNVQRIVLEMLGVTLSKDARARAVQLPAWNEALGLPRPWDQQWSLRLQQVLAYESDLLEYDDIFDGLARDRGEGRRAGRERHGRDGPRAGDGRGDRGRRERLHEAGAGLGPRRPARPDRVGRGGGRRRQQVRDDRAVAADRRPRRRDPGRRPGGRAGGDRQRRGLEGRARRDRGDRGARPAGRRRQDRHQPDARHPGGGPGRRDDRRVGGHPAGGVRRVPGADRRERRGGRSVGGGLGRGGARRGTPTGAARPARSSAAGCACWSASRVSTGTRTAPSRSPSGPGTPASR